MSIKQNGGVFGRNPTFNDVTIEGQLTFDGDIDINSDLKVDGDVDVTGTAIVDKLGINTPTPASALDIVGANQDAIRIRSTVASDQYYQVGRNQSTGVLELKGSEATYNGYLFKGPSSDLMEITAAGDVTVGKGNLVIGTAGKGIDFSATAGTGTSELLDDYEEGTFTPVLADATSGGNEASVLSAYGYYTKVGRVVTVTISITNPNTTGLTATNNVYITGLPFSAFSLAGGIYYTAPLAGGGNFATAGTYLGSVGDNTSYMTILKADFGGSTTFQKVSAINTGVTDIVTSLSYFA